ncbi:MAG TPA: hypothetical protein PKW79_05190 [Rhabdochlamydiaceae bacterium]|nr:hypothetical protein [Rhabdochlamydiaceae bacterium]
MALKYTVSAAGLSIESMLQQIMNASEIESEQYQMLKDSTATYITMAQNAKVFTEASLKNQAEELYSQGAAAIAGSVTSLVATGVCLGMSTKYENDASNLEKPNEAETEMVAKPAAPEEIEVQDVSEFKDQTTVQGHRRTSADTYEIPEEESAQITAKRAAESESTELADKNSETKGASKTEEQSAEDKVKSEREEQAKALRSKSNLWMMYNQSIPQSISQSITGIGAMIQASYKADEATNQGLATLYSQMPSVWNNMFGLENGVISAEESSKQGDISVWASIIQASTGMRG